MEWYYILIVVLFSSSMLGAISYGVLSDCWDVCVPMPSDFECYTEMNWFGCIVCYILLFILFPIWNIGKFIYWSFHVKRGEHIE